MMHQPIIYSTLFLRYPKSGALSIFYNPFNNESDLICKYLTFTPLILPSFKSEDHHHNIISLEKYA